jgi:transposase, IS30 family
MVQRELDLRERRRIDDMLRAKVRVDEIAMVLGRHRSKIYHETRRNRFVDSELPYPSGNWAVVAQNKAVARGARLRKLVTLPSLLDVVVGRLKAGWSLEQIAVRLRREDQAVTVSHETIYAHVYSREGRAVELACQLPDRRSAQISLCKTPARPCVSS